MIRDGYPVWQTQEVLKKTDQKVICSEAGKFPECGDCPHRKSHTPERDFYIPIHGTLAPGDYCDEWSGDCNSSGTCICISAPLL